MKTMTRWHFSFFGGVEASSGSVSLNDLMGKKAGAVLALLALAPGRARPREEIIDLVWPEVNFEEARDRFKQQLTFLRKLLEPDGTTPGSVLITNRSQAGIASEHQSDVAQFQDRLRRAAMATDPQVRAQCLREALDLYKGEFAPGFYLDFLLTERARLATLAEEARARLAALEASQATSAPATLPALTVTPRTVHTQNRFFGREQERKHLLQLVTQHRLVTLLGPGGTGKTRLLQELQADLPHARLIFLSTLRNGAAIPDAIVAALDLPDANDAALTRLQGAFADKETLLLLDNLEQLVASGGAEAIARLLETIPTLRCLVTSRLKLNLPQECVSALAPLPHSDAVELFTNRASLARSSFTCTDENREAIDQLCQRLDGLPLAIELAAARTAILTVPQILDRLARRFDLLADQRRDREERHTSLRAALDWGWGLLASDVQHFFTQLCVFRGSFSLEAAEGVTGEFLAVDYLQCLADASFLVVEGGEGSQRFRLLETLREYGREKGDADTAQLLSARHGDFFLERARHWGSQLEGAAFGDAMTLFKQDHDNFIAALDASLRADPVQALELCRHLADFWRYAYLKHEALNYLKRTLSAVQADGVGDKLDNNQWTSLHGSLANTYESLLDLSNAHSHFQEALAYNAKQLHATVGDENRATQRYRAGILHNFANNLCYQNRFEEAQSYFSEAAALNRSLGNNAWLANNLYGLAYLCGMRASTADTIPPTVFFEQGLAYAQEAVSLCRAISQGHYLCFMLSIQSTMLLGLERDGDALPVLAEAFTLATTLETWEVLAELLIHYHHLAFRGRYWSEAAQLLGSMAGISKRWSIILDAGQMPHLAITEARRQTLSDILGEERYHQLYQDGFQAGFQVSVERLRALISPLAQDGSAER